MSADDTPPRVWFADGLLFVERTHRRYDQSGYDIVQIRPHVYAGGMESALPADAVELRPVARTTVPMFPASVIRQWEDLAVERGYDLDAAHGRIDTLSRLLRGMARRARQRADLLADITQALGYGRAANPVFLMQAVEEAAALRTAKRDREHAELCAIVARHSPAPAVPDTAEPPATINSELSVEGAVALVKQVAHAAFVAARTDDGMGRRDAQPISGQIHLVADFMQRWPGSPTTKAIAAALARSLSAAEYREDVDTLVASTSTGGEEPAAGNVAKLLLRCEEVDRTTWCADGDPAGGGHIATAEVWRLLAPGRAPASEASS